MPTRPTDVRGRVGEARVAVEASAGAQADEDLAWAAPLQALLQLHGIVARVEDEHGSEIPLHGRPAQAQERLYLLCANPVGLLRRVDARDVHGGCPALAGEVELGDELVGPACDDGLAGRVAGRVVVETALGARLRVATIPYAHVHGKDGWFVLCPFKRDSG